MHGEGLKGRVLQSLLSPCRLRLITIPLPGCGLGLVVLVETSKVPDRSS